MMRKEFLGPAVLVVAAAAGCKRDHKEVHIEMEMTALSAGAKSERPPPTSKLKAPASKPEPPAPAPREPDPLVSTFLRWAEESWARPGNAATPIECYPPGDPDAGWCIANKYVDNEMMGVKFWKAQPAAVAFDVPGLKHAVSCADIGPHDVKSEHRTSHAAHTHCQLTHGPFKGHHVDIQRKQGTWHLFLFSKEYVVKDGAFAREVLGR